jgi:hypothetical protein
MTDAHRDLPARWEESDVACVVRTLHHSGPRLLRELLDDPDLDGWPVQRLEDAVISAWSLNLIFVDTSDLLVAL